MVYIDWKRISAITPDNFEEDEKEELLETVAWFNPPPDIDRQQLVTLLRVIQEILKYKSEQVDSLMSALDELAMKQGEEVARGRQDLLDEIDDLKEQLEYIKRLERESGVSDDQLRSEVVRLEMQNEDLVLELLEKEKDLIAEKAESERLISQVARLEREKLEISRELSAYQEESSDRRGRSVSDSPDGSTEKIEEMVEMVRLKNKHIMQLLDDVEAVEQENKKLRVKLTTARDEITEANNIIADLTQEHTKLKIQVDDERMKNNELSDKNKALASQVDELIEKKAKNDRDLDDFAEKLNERVGEWKRLLDLRDQEIITLKEEMEKSVVMETSWNKAEPELKTKFVHDQFKISELTDTITRLEMEKEECLKTIDVLKRKMSDSQETLKANNKIFQLEGKVQELENQLKMGEKEAIRMEKEISDLVGQVRAYESREFGLTEAMELVKKLQRRIQEREKKIENLVETCNELGIEKSNLEDENIHLREKLGLSPTHIIDASSIRKKSESYSKTIQDLNNVIEKLNSEILELRLKNRELLTQLNVGSEEISLAGHKVMPAQSEDQLPYHQHLETKYLQSTEENDALRKGLQEILDIVQTTTLGEVQAKSLERLLEALDARHISGWYHPAMRLQAQLQTIKGECKELRIQVSHLRKENVNLTHNLKISGTERASLDDRLPRDSPRSNQEVTEEHVEPGVESEQRIIELEIALNQSKFAFEKYKTDSEQEKIKLMKERDDLLARTNDATSAEVISSKALEYFNYRETILEAQLDDFRQKFICSEEISLTKIIQLQKEKSNLLFLLRNLEKQIAVQESPEKMQALENEIMILKFKLNKTINTEFTKGGSKISSSSADPHKCDVETLTAELKDLKQKLHEAEAQLNIFGDNVTPDAFNNELSKLSDKLATSEVELSNEKSKRIHLEQNQIHMISTQTQNEEKIKELTQEVQDLSSTNLKLQDALLQAENHLKSKTMFEEMTANEKEFEIKYNKLVTEKQNVEELLELSRRQCKSLQTWREARKLEREALNELIIKDDKIAKAKMSQELVLERTRNLELKMKHDNDQAKISRMVSENLAKDHLIMSVVNEYQRMTLTNLAHFKFLYLLLNRTHNMASSALCFPTLDKACKIMEDIEKKKKEFSESLLKIKERDQTLKIKEDELQIQLEALYDLKSAFQSDSKNLVSWHNKTTELRLRETRYKRQNQYLKDEVQQLQLQIEHLKRETLVLEERELERERIWEDRLMEWEKLQLALCELTGNTVPDNIKVTTSEEERSCFQIEISELKRRNLELMEEIQQKEAVSRDKLDGYQVQEFKSPHMTDIPVMEHLEESQKNALIITINNLEAIIKQKEETIFRYRELLKKNKEEHGKNMRRVQNELRNVHSALASQSKAYSRLKHGEYHPASQDVEKYVFKVQELEEEIAEAQGNLTRVTSQLQACQHEADNWRKVADQRVVELDQIRSRMEEEIEQCREEAQGYQTVAERLREMAEGNQSQMLIQTLTDLQKKITQFTEKQTQPTSSKRTADESGLSESPASPQPLRRQLTACRDECTRLREQVRALQNMKRRPEARPEDKTGHLVDKIRILEETVRLSKQHERELEENGLKRMRSVEEVTRWDERKRHQKAMEKLQAKLKQKEIETSVALNKMDTMRTLLTKMEKDKAILESQVKSLKAIENNSMQSLVTEKAKLEAQVSDLEEQLASLKNIDGEKAAAMLHVQLEEQEKIIANLKLTNQAPKALAMEIERLKNNLNSLEKHNVQLQTESVSLKMNLVKLREENVQLWETKKRLEAEHNARKRTSPSRAQVRSSYELQREFNKVKSDLKVARDKQSMTEDRNAQLEAEIQRMHTQLHLWEEKDIADTFARTNEQKIISELQQELMQVKAQLAHKVHLLDRVKILLSKAAAKEKALTDKVSALQSSISLQ